MKVRLQTKFADALREDESIALAFGRTLQIYRPADPRDNPDVEIRMGTIAGDTMIQEYERDKHKWFVGIAQPYMEDEQIFSRISKFNSKSEAIAAVTEHGIDVGFMPLHRLMIATGYETKLQIV